MLISGLVFWSLAETDRIAYANETNIVNKDSPIDSLTLKNQTTTTLTRNHTQAAITVSYSRVEPRVQSIHFQEYFAWVRKTVDQCYSTGRRKHVSRLEKTERHFGRLTTWLQLLWGCIPKNMTADLHTSIHLTGDIFFLGEKEGGHFSMAGACRACNLA